MSKLTRGLGSLLKLSKPRCVINIYAALSLRSLVMLLIKVTGGDMLVVFIQPRPASANRLLNFLEPLFGRAGRAGRLDWVDRQVTMYNSNSSLKFGNRWWWWLNKSGRSYRMLQQTTKEVIWESQGDELSVHILYVYVLVKWRCWAPKLMTSSKSENCNPCLAVCDRPCAEHSLYSYFSICFFVSEIKGWLGMTSYGLQSNPCLKWLEMALWMRPAWDERANKGASALTKISS